MSYGNYERNLSLFVIGLFFAFLTVLFPLLALITARELFLDLMGVTLGISLIIWGLHKLKSSKGKGLRRILIGGAIFIFLMIKLLS